MGLRKVLTINRATGQHPESRLIRNGTNRKLLDVIKAIPRQMYGVERCLLF